MMATLVESADIEPSCSSKAMDSPPSSSFSHRFLDNKFYLLVVIGETVSEEHLKCAIADIEKGKKDRVIFFKSQRTDYNFV